MSKAASDVLTVKQVKERLNIGQRQAYKLVNEPGFPSIRIGGSIRVPRKMFDEWMEKQAESDQSNPRKYAY